MTHTPSSMPIDRSGAVCVIGGGPGGPATARALKAQGLACDRFERHDDVCGIAPYLHGQQDSAPSAAYFDDLIRESHPDLSGNIRFVDSQRHELYLYAHGTKGYLHGPRARMGWKEVDERMYDHLKRAHRPTSHGVAVPAAAPVLRCC